MATSTCSVFLREPKALHTGINVLIGQHVYTAAVGDVIKLGKVPDRAVLVEGYIDKLDANGDLTVRLNIPMTGDDGTASNTYTTLFTASGAGRTALALAALNYQVSISDAVIVKEATLEAICASATVTGTTKFCLQFTLGDRP